MEGRESRGYFKNFKSSVFPCRYYYFEHRGGERHLSHRDQEFGWGDKSEIKIHPDEVLGDLWAPILPSPCYIGI